MLLYEILDADTTVTWSNKCCFVNKQHDSYIRDLSRRIINLGRLSFNWLQTFSAIIAAIQSQQILLSNLHEFYKAYYVVNLNYFAWFWDINKSPIISKRH